MLTTDTDEIHITIIPDENDSLFPVADRTFCDMAADYLSLSIILITHYSRSSPKIDLAGVDGNRTHHGPRQPTIGFEVRGQHQTANYSLSKKQYRHEQLTPLINYNALSRI